jgi:hypothetical protein
VVGRWPCRHHQLRASQLWWRQPFHAYDKESALLKWVREACTWVLQRGIHRAVYDFKVCNAAQTHACIDEWRWMSCRVSSRHLSPVWVTGGNSPMRTTMHRFATAVGAMQPMLRRYTVDASLHQCRCLSRLHHLCRRAAAISPCV